jgi:hypothetical protein
VEFLRPVHARIADVTVPTHSAHVMACGRRRSYYYLPAQCAGSPR